MNLDDIRNSYLAEGFSFIDAGSRTCQDVVLALIGSVAICPMMQF